MTLVQTRSGHDDGVVTENADGAGGFVILCDHASNTMPESYAGLGLAEADLQGHIAWDSGALAVARLMAKRLDAPLLWPDASRLIIDCNRASDAPDLIVRTGEGKDIPGNRNLRDEDRQARIRTIHQPYHAAIEACLDKRFASGLGCSLIAMHSYTPVFFGKPRPWPVGILFNRDPALGNHVIDGLRSDGELNVGVNQPYSPADGVYYTLSRHGEQRGLATMMVEIRNDEIATPADQAAWAARLAGVLETAGRLGADK